MQISSASLIRTYDMHKRTHFLSSFKKIMVTSILLMARMESWPMLLDLDLVLEEMHTLMRQKRGVKASKVGGK
jgi:hypothetical protein